MTPNQSKSFSSTDRTERKVGPLLAFSLSYLDEVLEGESLEVQRHWSRVQAAASASAINAELLEALEGLLNEAHTASKGLHYFSEWSNKARAAIEKATA